VEGFEALLGRLDAAQQRAQLELVPAGVQGRVGEHGDADELDLVEQALGVVAPAAAGPGLAAAVVVEAQRGGLTLAPGLDGVVGADHVAHGAVDAGIGRIGALADAVVDGVDIGGLGLEAGGRVHHALPVHGQLDGADRADRGTAAAQGAGLDVPVDLPGQILDAQC